MLSRNEPGSAFRNPDTTHPCMASSPFAIQSQIGDKSFDRSDIVMEQAHGLIAGSTDKSPDTFAACSTS
jgi:hypothetical protein